MKFGVRAGVIGAGFLALGAMSGAAQAQAWIGQIAGDMAAAQMAAQREHDCMMGIEMFDSEVNETRISTRATMAQYWQSVAGRQAADVRGSFHVDDGKARWNLGEKVVWEGGLARISDPFARTGATLEPEPRSYLRSGDGKAVSGLWAVRGSSGDAIGFYDARFTRVAGTWK